MSKPLLHPMTATLAEGFLQSPGHALLLVGATGSGKHTLARWLGAELLSVDSTKISEHPYVKIVEPGEAKSIGVDTIRELERFLRLRVPSTSSTRRLIIIEEGHLLTHEAQNALLKTLEEPPEGTVLIVTVAHEDALLPTIRSRAQQIQVKRLDPELLSQHYASAGFEASNVRQAMLVSGGLPGLAQALLTDSEHPLTPAITAAREVLGKTTYERLLMVDELAKQRSSAIDVLFILQQMAEVSLQSAAPQNARKWQKILEASYDATDSLRLNAQPKLVLTDLMLNL